MPVPHPDGARVGPRRARPRLGPDTRSGPWAGLVLVLVGGLVLAGCDRGSARDAVDGAGPVPASTTARSVEPTAPGASGDQAKRPALPPTSGVFDYQLGGTAGAVTLDGVSTPIDVVERDATARPLPGAYDVCYVNGFQTQPDQRALWRAHDDLLLHADEGRLVVDPDWPDEYVLDPSTAAKRRGILAILGPVVRGCADDGFDAVELDNLDTWTRFEAVDKAGALALARAYVNLAHRSGLAVAQKNAAELAPVAHRLGFDFAVTEECAAYDECAAYTGVYGRHVLEVEYPDSLRAAGLTFAEVCRSSERGPLTILRDRELVAPGEPGYQYDSC